MYKTFFKGCWGKCPDALRELTEMVNKEGGSQLQWCFLDGPFLSATYWVDDGTTDTAETTES